MERILHELIQGSPEWHQFRLEHDGASEAAAMLGLSKTTTRTELLRAKSTGIAKEFSDFVQKRILDKGHEVEALARPIAEKLIGDDLYPATYSLGRLSASCDGLTMDDVTAFEHKQFNAALAAAVARGELPEEHMPQCQQVLMVTGAQRLLFMVSDGTEENMESMYVQPDQKWFARIRAGWAQFEQDLANYQHVEVIPAAIAAPVMALPALSIQVNGAITLTDNLAIFGEKLTAFIERLPAKPETDTDFANCEQAIKTLETAQNALEAAESSALAQVASVDEMRRTVALYAGQARSTRLMLTKLVAARKEQIRVEIVQGGRHALNEHVNALNRRLGKALMPIVSEDFAGVIKGKKTINSIRDSIDTELARVKIEANAAADLIQINLNSLRELAGSHAFLFADTAQIITKSNDDLVNLIKLRISEHTAAEAKRLDTERDRIRLEEQAKAETEARAKVDAEQTALREQADAKVAQDRAEQEIKDKRIAQALADEEARLMAERNKAAEASRAIEVDRQKTLDTDQLIVALYERIKGVRGYTGIAKAIETYLAKTERKAA